MKMIARYLAEKGAKISVSRCCSIVQRQSLHAAWFSPAHSQSA
jgi:hypothetical protein